MLEKLLEQIKGNGGFNIVAFDIGSMADLYDEKTAIYCAKKALKYLEFSNEAPYAFVKAVIKMDTKSEMHRIAKFFDNNTDMFEIFNDNTFDYDKEYTLKLYKLLNKEKDEVLDISDIIRRKNKEKEIIDYLLTVPKEVVGEATALLGYLVDHKSGKDFVNTLEMLKLYHNKSFFGVGYVVNRTATLSHDDSYRKIIQIYDRYHDNKHSNITKAIMGLGRDLGYEKLDFDNLDQLLSARAYNEIKKTKNPTNLIKKIISKYYGEAHHIMDPEIGFSDLDLVRETLDFVLNVHNNRTVQQRNQIEEGFYDELQRAMDQGDKSYMLRQYCIEVKNRIKENVGDLMVVTNGA